MFRNLSIKSRLVFVVSFLSLLLVAGGVIGLTSLSAANDALKTSYENRLVPLDKLDHVVRMIDANQLAVAQALTDEPAAIARAMDEVDARIEDVNAVWNAYIASGLSSGEKKLADQFAADRKKFVDEGLRPATVALRAQNLLQATELMRKSMKPLFVPMQNDVNALMQFQLDVAKKEFVHTQDIYQVVRNSCVIAILFGVLLGATICVWLVRGIARPLAHAVAIAKSVAAGDLTRAIHVRSSDETGQLLQALKDMNESLVRIVGEVRGGTETIATASGQIASGNMDLSSRTEQQAGSLETTASSMERITAIVLQNAESADQANRLALSASDIAVQGGAVVSEVVHTMGSINDSAKKIVDIIGVIDSIAFQTNILALNAAVEAARAGEQGRGFAVVAGEVRHLAQRSAAAAKEIKQLIGDSVEKVDTGARLVDQAGATMAEIVASVCRVTDIMGEITVASREQTEGIQRLNQAMSQMDAVTQQNAALVEESAAASAALQQQAAALAHVVSVFKVTAKPTASAPVWQDGALVLHDFTGKNQRQPPLRKRA